jgi:hypothetical protein
MVKASERFRGFVKERDVGMESQKVSNPHTCSNGNHIVDKERQINPAFTRPTSSGGSK